MMVNRIMRYTVLLLLVSASLACSGSGGARSVTTPGPSGSFVATFTPDQSAPAAGEIGLTQAAGGGGDLVSLNVSVNGVNDLFGASFRIAYDPSLVEFDNWSAGSLVEGAGQPALYQVAIVQPGVVEVGVSCAACTSGINVGATQNLVQLIFRATQSGSSSLTFVAADLLDSGSPPGPIGGLNWFGGTLVAN
jgi:hypothetical protein